MPGTLPCIAQGCRDPYRHLRAEIYCAGGYVRQSGAAGAVATVASSPQRRRRQRTVRQSPSIAGMTFNRSRRDLCIAAAGLGLLPTFGTASAADALPMRLVLLGTAGGPRPRKTRSAPAQAILVGDRTYVVDCGDGVARQMVLADIALDSLRGVFITHQHSDHTADFGNLLLLAWPAGLRTPVEGRGPQPLEQMAKLFLQMNAADINTRIQDE